MSDHPNVALHRGGHQAFREGNIEALRNLFSEETVWHWPGKSPLGGEFRGREAVLSLLAKIGELTDSIEFVDHEFLANDTKTAALSTLTVTRGGKTLEYDSCEIVRWRDGKVVEEWILVDDQYAYDDFWS